MLKFSGKYTVYFYYDDEKAKLAERNSGKCKPNFAIELEEDGQRECEGNVKSMLLSVVDFITKIIYS